MPLKNIFFTVLVITAIYNVSPAQNTPQAIYRQVADIEKLNVSPEEKLQKEQALKTYYEQHYHSDDSVYAFLLHRVALLYTKTNKNFTEAIRLTKQAARINLSGGRNKSDSFAINSLYNIGNYYETLANFTPALAYYDTAIQHAEKLPAQISFFYKAHIRRSIIYYNLGNFQEALNDAMLGLSRGEDSTNALFIGKLYYYAAQASIEISPLPKALSLINKAVEWSRLNKDNLLLAKYAMLKADVAARQNDAATAATAIAQSLNLGKKEEDPDQKAILLLEAGSIYFSQLHDFTNAAVFFKQVVTLHNTLGCADKYLASAVNNLGYISFKNGQLPQALHWYFQASNLWLEKYAKGNILAVPLMRQIQSLPAKNDLFISLSNKAELLMLNYKQTSNRTYLQAALKTFSIADSIITLMRHEQTGEASKLYWRVLTHRFHQQALETCLLLNDANAAFYFMEKSRAALLNDRLNELGAGSQLPAAEAAREQTLRMAVVEKQIKLSDYKETDAEYNKAQQQVLVAQQNLERYIYQLEEKIPAYYQYKYADEVPAVDQLQQYLQRTSRQFVQYFAGDTVLYILHVSGMQCSLYRQSLKDAGAALSKFLQRSTDPEWQNKNFAVFKTASWQLYKNLFQQFRLHPGSLIISPDNALIPFDALCTDTVTGRLMVQDFAISYTYSARSLLKPFNAGNKPAGEFLGMAPVSFPAAMQLPPLKSSKEALEKLQKYYPDATLLSEKDATRQALLKNISAYTIVNLYTHAQADSSSAEPQLFLSDSAIRLSELQIIQQPATQLVVLSACQTNTGRVASGEGVYSIARGFAMAGIPAAVATLWKADEQATYFITREFHKNISQGMAKDIALQQAKLSWLQQCTSGQTLPFYWANFTLMGNADAIVKPAHTRWWFAAAALVILLVIAFIWQRAKRKITG